ncbi:hypothetical protein E4U32_006321 [Claviceps aff. humidiphila group G2b]|nr:hypothetical protein E4U32_006321 [Claviceps aff. humidiphila group G2b]
MTGFNQYQGSGNTPCSGMLCDLDLNIVQHDEDTAARAQGCLNIALRPLSSRVTSTVSVLLQDLAQEELIITDKIAIYCSEQTAVHLYTPEQTSISARSARHLAVFPMGRSRDVLEKLWDVPLEFPGDSPRKVPGLSLYALLMSRVTKLDEDIFGEEDKLKDPATREIFSAYWTFRVFWHHLLRARHIDP